MKTLITIVAFILPLTICACSDDTKQPVKDAKPAVEATVAKDGMAKEATVVTEASVKIEASAAKDAKPVQ